MATEVNCPSIHVGSVLSDLVSRRRASIRHVLQPDEASERSSSSSITESSLPASQVILADVPLAELRGYASALRSTTQGSGSFSMEVADFRVVPQHVVTALQKR